MFHKPHCNSISFCVYVTLYLCLQAMDEAATIEGLETRSMTGSTISSRLGAVHGLLPVQDARVAYTGYRQAVYDQKLPITPHRDHVSAGCYG